jgi:hypothetical protein
LKSLQVMFFPFNDKLSNIPVPSTVPYKRLPPVHTAPDPLAPPLALTVKFSLILIIGFVGLSPYEFKYFKASI